MLTDQQSTTPVIERADNNGTRESTRLNQSVFEPPNSFGSADTRKLNWVGASFVFLGLIWLGLCIALYPVGASFNVNVVYEGRWLLAPLLFTGIFSLLFRHTHSESIFISIALGLVYTIASCLVTLMVYGMNLIQAVLIGSNRSLSTKRRFFGPVGRKQYIQICTCLLLVSLAVIPLASVLGWRLYRLAYWHYKTLPINYKRKQYLQIAGWAQMGLSLFSLYVTSQIITLSSTFLHAYMLLELFCALVLLLMSIAQAVLAQTCNAIVVKFLLIINLTQFCQELFYAWNSYFISIYLHSVGMRFTPGIQFDQIVMTLNFLGHFSRMALTAYSSWVLIDCLKLVSLRKMINIDLSKSVYYVIIGLASSSLLIGACHILMDIIYATKEHIYRTLLAFTGISVFYSNCAGISLSLFLRSRQIVFLVLGASLFLLLISCSAHAIYIYLQSTYSLFLFDNLQTTTNEKYSASIMHFIEALLAFYGIILAIVAVIMLIRLLRMESRHENRQQIATPIYWLRFLGVIILVLAVIEATFLLRVKLHWKMTDRTVNYGVLDTLAMFVLCFLQLYVSRPSNNHIYYPMLVLFILLLAECLTSFNYLSAQTSYVQIVIMLRQVDHLISGTRRVALTDNFPVDQLVSIVAGHVIQIVQWALVVLSLATCGVCIERMHGHTTPVIERELSEAVYLNQAYDTNTLGDESTQQTNNGEQPHQQPSNSQITA